MSNTCVFCKGDVDSLRGHRCEFVYRQKKLTRHVCDSCWKYYYGITGRRETMKRVVGYIRQNLEMSNEVNNTDSDGRLFWDCSLCNTRFFDRTEYIAHHYYHE